MALQTGTRFLRPPPFADQRPIGRRPAADISARRNKIAVVTRPAEVAARLLESQFGIRPLAQTAGAARIGGNIFRHRVGRFVVCISCLGIHHRAHPGCGGHGDGYCPRAAARAAAHPDDAHRQAGGGGVGGHAEGLAVAFDPRRVGGDVDGLQGFGQLDDLGGLRCGGVVGVACLVGGYDAVAHAFHRDRGTRYGAFGGVQRAVGDGIPRSSARGNRGDGEGGVEGEDATCRGLRREGDGLGEFGGVDDVGGADRGEVGVSDLGVGEGTGRCATGHGDGGIVRPSRRDRAASCYGDANRLR